MILPQLLCSNKLFLLMFGTNATKVNPSYLRFVHGGKRSGDALHRNRQPLTPTVIEIEEYGCQHPGRREDNPDGCLIVS